MNRRNGLYKNNKANNNKTKKIITSSIKELKIDLNRSPLKVIMSMKKTSQLTINKRMIKEINSSSKNRSSNIQ